MDIKLKKYFEEKYLKNTCFDSFEDLMNDKSNVFTNAPRSLVAVELTGVWRGLNDTNHPGEDNHES